MTGDATQAPVNNDATDETTAEVAGIEQAGAEQVGTGSTGAEQSDGGESDAAEGSEANDSGENGTEAGSRDEDKDDEDRDGEPDGDDDRLVDEGEIAADYLEQLLDVLDYDGDIDLDVDGDRAVVSIDGGKDLTKLVGRDGEVLDALQELTRLAVQQSTGDRSRLMLDVSGWRSDRRERLAGLGTEVAERVRDGGERESLDPMTPFERKIVHDAVAKVDGVYSESEGAEPKRRVVVIKE